LLYCIIYGDWCIMWVGMYCMGLQLMKLLVLFQIFLKPKCRINVLIFISSWFQYCVRMIITSTISPVLKIGLQLLGVWPGMSISYWLINILISILILQYYQYRYVLEHFKISQLSDLVDSLSAALSFSLIIFKITSIWIHRG